MADQLLTEDQLVAMHVAATAEAERVDKLVIAHFKPIIAKYLEADAFEAIRELTRRLPPSVVECIKDIIFQAEMDAL